MERPRHLFQYPGKEVIFRLFLFLLGFKVPARLVFYFFYHYSREEERTQDKYFRFPNQEKKTPHTKQIKPHNPTKTPHPTHTQKNTNPPQKTICAFRKYAFSPRLIFISLVYRYLFLSKIYFEYLFLLRTK